MGKYNIELSVHSRVYLKVISTDEWISFLSWQDH